MMVAAPDINSVMFFVFQIKDYKLDVYFNFLNTPKSSITKISKFFGKNGGSIQVLMKKGMITRKVRAIGTGGFTCVCTTILVEEAKEQMDRELKLSSGMMRELAKNFAKR